MNYLENYTEIERITNEIHKFWDINRGSILTESDLQAYFFLKLNESDLFKGVSRIKDNVNTGTRVHLELKWFNQQEKLNICPDISIIETSGLEINSTSTTRLPSKRYGFNGSAILIELKLHRSNTNFSATNLEGIKKDLRSFRTLTGRHPESIQVFEIIFDRYTGTSNKEVVDELFNNYINKKFHVFYRNQT